jgi:hypothetical protein
LAPNILQIVTGDPLSFDVTDEARIALVHAIDRPAQT